MSVTGRILIVEDDRELARALVDGLTRAGFACAVVCDGANALTWLHKNPLPRLVLLDLQLPRVEGHEIWNYMRHDEKLQHVPTIVVTGCPDLDEKGFQGAAGFLRKPFSLDRLIAAIHRARCGVQDGETRPGSRP